MLLKGFAPRGALSCLTLSVAVIRDMCLRVRSIVPNCVLSSFCDVLSSDFDNWQFGTKQHQQINGQRATVVFIVLGTGDVNNIRDVLSQRHAYNL